MSIVNPSSSAGISRLFQIAAERAEKRIKEMNVAVNSQGNEAVKTAQIEKKIW